MKKIIGIIGLLALSFACREKEEKFAQQIDLGYAIQPVDIKDVHITDEFWLPIISQIQSKTIPYAIEKCEEEGRFENFLIAGGQKQGTVRGEMPFDDSDVYKIIEGISNTLISVPNAHLEAQLDSIIKIVSVGQEKDGYLTTWRTINPKNPPAPWVEVIKGERWESLFMSHELYNAGHLYEAAVAHYLATKKRSLLDIAIKNADLMVKTFGDKPEQIQGVPGHQIIETGLIKLYQVTNKEEYLQLAKYFLDHRGVATNRTLFGEYSQDHKPVVEQQEVVGHAVRAVYMYAGMTDIAAIYKDKAYENAVLALWNNMVGKKTYVTGGIGSRHDGEAFGDNYELPNLTAYNETCAAIGSIYWNHRLFNFSGDSKYFDVLERTLYNGMLSGISLDGVHFFYPNPLEADAKYTFNRGSCSRQSWFDCSCCPTNLIRFIPSIPGLIYAQQDKSLYVNLYIANQSEVSFGEDKIKIEQKTNFLNDGKVKIILTPKQATQFTLKLRVPNWAKNEVLPSDLYQFKTKLEKQTAVYLNGEKIDFAEQNGYIVIDRKWKENDYVELYFPMKIREIFSNPEVKSNQGQVALQYGPVVYAVESVDNPHFDNLKITPTTQYTLQRQEALLNGVNVIRIKQNEQEFVAIPYFSWANRGLSKMKVWLPYNDK